MMKKVTHRKSDDEKLRELILYISQRCEQDERLGVTKLNKLLFYIEFSAYLTYGKAITNQEYFRLPQGPAPQRFMIVKKAMERQKELAISTRLWHGHEQKRPIALRIANLDLFTAEEISLVDEIIARYWGMTASDISESSHNFLGWICANEQERIPYQIALVGTRDLKEREIEYGQSLELRAAECLSGATS
ncbi:MAG: SocA family protein [Candidatus Hydrogenedentes bacterium]|nr:SocA family protein [Candidatus Hydrogenedentota bacterium]